MTDPQSGQEVEDTGPIIPDNEELGIVFQRPAMQDPPPPALSPASLLAGTVLAKALGPRLLERVRTKDHGMLVCAVVPDPSWESPLREAAKRYERPLRFAFRDVSVRYSLGSIVSVDEALYDLSRGRALLYASQDRQGGIPSELRTVADVTVELAMPTPDVIAAVVSMLNGGRSLRHVPKDLGHGLTLHEIAGCLRPAEPTRRILARFRRAQDAKRTLLTDAGPRLEDLAGYGEAADWGSRLKTDIAAYRAGTLPWRDIDAQAILFGPPGTGKTLFARALAKSLDVTCIQTSVGHWFTPIGGGDLGSTIRAAAAAFAEARAAVRNHGVALLFIDEIDGLPNRSALDSDRASWWRPVVNYALASLDGAATILSGVVVVAATNDIDAVEPALLRPGRLGTHLAVLPPDLDGLTNVLLHHLGGAACPIPLSEVRDLLRPFVGATQASAAAWGRGARHRARADRRAVSLMDVAAVLAPVDTRPAEQRRRAATHEAGHAVVGALLASSRLMSTSIVATSHTGGSTVFRSIDPAMLSRPEIEDDVIMRLAGRAAETLIGDGATTGAGGTGDENDLARATARLSAMHAAYGLGPNLRHRGDPTRQDIMRLDPELARLVEADLQRLMARAECLVSERADAVRAVAEALLDAGFLEAITINRIVAEHPPTVDPRRGA